MALPLLVFVVFCVCDPPRQSTSRENRRAFGFLPVFFKGSAWYLFGRREKGALKAFPTSLSGIYCGGLTSSSIELMIYGGY